MIRKASEIDGLDWHVQKHSFRKLTSWSVELYMQELTSTANAWLKTCMKTSRPPTFHWRHVTAADKRSCVTLWVNLRYHVTMQ